MQSFLKYLPEKCDWCPLVCGADRAHGQKGLCGANDELLVSRAALHFWEEPPISGIIGGPKRDQGPGSGTIFFSNCSMKCVYCQNHKISGTDDDVLGTNFTIDELVDACLDLQNQGAMNINFVTPTHYRSLLITATRLARNKGLLLPIVWNTSGYETAASVFALASTVDVWLTDFKYSNNKTAQKYSGNPVKNYVEVALEALEAMLDLCEEAKFDNFKNNIRITKGVIVRHLLLPGEFENSKFVLEMLFEKFGNNIKYSIMNQYTPVLKAGSNAANKHLNLLNTPSEEEYEDLLDYADQLGIKDYYWQNGSTCSESFIPQFK